MDDRQALAFSRGGILKVLWSHPTGRDVFVMDVLGVFVKRALWKREEFARPLV